MIAIFKYIINANNMPILFSKDILHNTIGHEAKSAGFLIVDYDHNKERFVVKCFGESTTLNIKSNPIEDKIIIEMLLNGKSSNSLIKEDKSLNVNKLKKTA